MKRMTDMLAVLALLILSNTLWASGGERKGRALLDPAYVQECGSCHVPYPARLLSAASWQSLLVGLDQHFGTDAAIDDPSVAAAVSRYLLEHAARKETLDELGRPFLRITGTRGFRHEHDELPAWMWTSSSVKSPANCGACHTTAEQGLFSEHAIHLPR
jgi:cytochrome c553